MFDLNTTILEENGYCTCFSFCKDSKTADEFRAGFVGPVRQINMFADLYCDGTKLIIAAPNRETLLKIVDILNHSIEWNA